MIANTYNHVLLFINYFLMRESINYLVMTLICKTMLSWSIHRLTFTVQDNYFAVNRPKVVNLFEVLKH